MKNEHIVYAYAPLLKGGNLLLVGITETGWEYLGEESGNFLKTTPPSGQFRVDDVWIVRAKDKAEIRQMMQTVADQAGIPLRFASTQ